MTDQATSPGDDSVEALRGLWPPPRAVSESAADPAAKEKAWQAAIAAATQAKRLVANAGEYGAGVANDPAKLFSDARDETQATANPAPPAGEKPEPVRADEAVSTVRKTNAAWDWSKIPKSEWEGQIRPLESGSSATAGVVKIVCTSIDPAAVPTESSRKVKLEGYLDLTDPAVREQLQVNDKTLLADEALVWHLGREAYVAGFNGLVIPSSADASGKMIVAFGAL